MNENELIENVYQKIQREEKLIQAASQMHAASDNENVRSRLDNQIRDGRRNIEYFRSRMRELQMKTVNQGMGKMSLGSGSVGGPSPPVHGGFGVQQSGNRNVPAMSANDSRGYAPGTDRSDYGNPGPGGYSKQLGGGHGSMPPRAPLSPPGPGAGAHKARPNYSRLDLIKADSPYLGPRIQLMLSQLEFKLSVEKQYKDGIEKMVLLYQRDGDRKSRQEAEARRVESTQKIQLLKQALKRYEDLHIDMDESEDTADDDSLNVPSIRRPLTGHLNLRIHAVKDVDHATSGRFSRGPETFVVMKVEDDRKGRTKATRNDRWTDEVHDIDIQKANEIELTVYDRSGDQALPIGMLWIRISDIVEEMRRKKIETEFNNSGWVSANAMQDKIANRPDLQFNPPPGSQGGPQHGAMGQTGTIGSATQSGPTPQTGPIYIESWFALEPAGRIHLTVTFAKDSKAGRAGDLGLARKGAIRQRKEEVHELFGHKFVTQNFFNIMRCALCEKFLKNATGMQCSDCKITCHIDCYSKVVTKCISKSNAETDPDEEKINHRIPHRFDVFSNLGANWCCHCGYMLPLGKTNCRKCSECKLTCHAQCVHLVPDFCGMSMKVANEILKEIRDLRDTKQKKAGSVQTMSSRTLRSSTSSRPTQAQTPPAITAAAQEQILKDPRYSYGKDQPSSDQVPPAHAASSISSIEAAKMAHSQVPPQPAQLQRPAPAPRKVSSQSAAAAAAAALSGKVTSPPKPPVPYQTSSPERDRAGGSAARPGAYASSRDTYKSQPGYGQNRVPQPSVQQPPQMQQPGYDPDAYAAVPMQPFSTPQTTQQQPAYPLAKVSQPPPAPSQQAPAPASQEVVQRKQASSAQLQGTGKRIGLDHFNFLAVLGKGNFGKVMLAETKTTKQLYAIKVLKKEFIIENDEVESTRSEKRVFLIANKERHPFLLNLHACFQTETRIYFVMEYISGGDLMLHIQRGQFGTRRAQFYAAEVCLALKYFHENGVIYRDLKLDNILLTLDGHIKIADYGLCKEEMWYGSTTSTFCGTPEFMAPEILLDKKYGRAVDWWAFGVLIYQMLLQQSPFRGEDEDEIYDAILADEPLYPIHMPRDSVSILQKLLTREPELRLGSGPTDAQEVMSHAFFRNINWDDVYHKRVPAPFLPQISSATDTSNFDQEFTSVTPVLTPVQSVLSQAMQEEFRGFSFVGEGIAGI